MGLLRTPALLDVNGQPLRPDLQDVLGDLWPKFLSRFPAFGDDLLAIEVFEEAARRVDETATGSWTSWSSTAIA